MISSAEVNKVIRRVVSPALRERGFTKVQTRNNWCHLDDRIWVLVIRSIGNTGLPDYFPSQSLHCEIGIYFPDFPPHPRPARRTKPKVDEDGLLVPKITDCHWRGNLTLIGDQSQLRQGLRHSQERNRKDVWWVNEDGSNVEDVLEDIKQSFVKKGLRRLEKRGSLEDFEELDWGRIMQHTENASRNRPVGSLRSATITPGRVIRIVRWTNASPSQVRLEGATTWPTTAVAFARTNLPNRST